MEPFAGRVPEPRHAQGRVDEHATQLPPRAVELSLEPGVDEAHREDSGYSGLALFGRESAWNHFQIGVSEWNGYFGIYDQGRENLYTVTNTNSNPNGGMVKGEKDELRGYFTDGQR